MFWDRARIDWCGDGGVIHPPQTASDKVKPEHLSLSIHCCLIDSNGKNSVSIWNHVIFTVVVFHSSSTCVLYLNSFMTLGNTQPVRLFMFTPLRDSIRMNIICGKYVHRSMTQCRSEINRHLPKIIIMPN